MTRFGWLALSLAVLAGTPARASAAPSVRFTMQNGRVWLEARDATLDQIFAEWARVGDLTIVNAEQLRGRVTIELAGVPEPLAIDLLLRPAAGFVAKRRESPDPAHSEFESIYIMAAGRGTPRAPVPAPDFAPPDPSSSEIAPGVQRIIGPDGAPVPDDQEDATPAQRQVSPGLPPGFSAPPPISAPPPRPDAEPAPQAGPQGTVPVPGMIVPAPPPPAPRPDSGRQ